MHQTRHFFQIISLTFFPFSVAVERSTSVSQATLKFEQGAFLQKCQKVLHLKCRTYKISNHWKKYRETGHSYWSSFHNFPIDERHCWSLWGVLWRPPPSDSSKPWAIGVSKNHNPLSSLRLQLYFWKTIQGVLSWTMRTCISQLPWQSFLLKFCSPSLLLAPVLFRSEM